MAITDRNVRAHYAKNYMSYRKQNAKDELLIRLREARTNEAIARRKKERKQEKINAFNNSAPLVRNSYLLKWCICIIMVMCILTFNTTGVIGVDTQLEYYDYELTEVHYTWDYYNSFYEEDTALNKVVNMGKSVETYGKNSAWTEIINAFSNITSFKSGIEAFGTMVILPINLCINFGTFFINLINSWTGREIITPFKLKYNPLVKQGVWDIISLPNLNPFITG